MIWKFKEQEELKLATIPLSVFRESFETWPGWEHHFEPGTPLMNLMNSEFFHPYPEEQPDDISVDRLILLGILLCKGTARMRA